MTALVARDVGVVALEQLALRAPGSSDVLVRIEASGLCHSDTSLVDGTLPGKFPVVLGHEGAGVVEEVGSAVGHLVPGQRVALLAMPSCGTCWHCVRAEPYLCDRSAELRRHGFTDGVGSVRGASGLGTFADAVVVDGRLVVPVHTDLPPDQIAIVGCAVMTGAGSVLNVAEVRPGESVLVIGAGGVGLAAIQGARLVGASVIVAVDPSHSARDAALASGATHVAEPDAVEGLVADLLGGRGVDAVIECVGSTTTFQTAWRTTRRGGRVVVVGASRPDQLTQIPLVDVMLSGKRVIGSVHGESVGGRDLPRYLALAEQGRLDLDALIGRHVRLDEMPDVIAHQVAGSGRTVMVAG